MPTELEELVEFLHHGNTEIRRIAIENLVGYSQSQADIFFSDGMTPIKDLKLLVKDYTPIAKDALTILINLSVRGEVLGNLVADDAFLESILARVANPNEPNVNLMAMLLANLAKSDDIKRMLHRKRPTPSTSLSKSDHAMDQLVDCFVKGADGRYNKSADFDYLSYFFADIAKFPEGRKYLVTRRPYDSVIPITKFIIFTEHASTVRRKGVASTIKNVAFDIESHPVLLSADEVDLLPYLLLPLAGPEDYTEEESEQILPDLQLLPPDKRREADMSIMTTHLETLLLLSTTRHGRDVLRGSGLYPIIRETHLHVEDDDVRDACDRLVQLIKRDEEKAEEETEEKEEKKKGEGEHEEQGTEIKGLGEKGNRAKEEDEEDEDEEEKMVEIL